MMTTTTDLSAWLTAEREVVDAALERYLPQTGDAPDIVTEAMRYSVFAGGKRLRPILALAAAEAVADRTGVDRTEARRLVLPAACALELIHTYSLVHDDLPAMDDDTMRRGRPTAHVVFGEGQAILSGDALLTEAFALLAVQPASSAVVPPDALAQRKLRTTAIIARAAGAAGMVGGQALDLRAAGPGAASLDAERLRDMHSRKTGALILASCLSGGVMGGATDPLLEAIRRYGLQIGLAFQIVDDILDVEGATADLGKTAGKDAAAGKPTYPSLYGLDESRKLAAECLSRALEVLESAGLGGRLPAIAHWVVGRTN
jgi:geranylgeranyl diphosphate synthase type II